MISIKETSLSVSVSPSAPLSTLGRTQMPYVSGLKRIVRHTPYVRLVFGFLFASLAFQVWGLQIVYGDASLSAFSVVML